MAIETELVLRLPNSPGALQGVCRLLADERVNVRAMMLEGSGHLRLVVDNRVRAAGVLRDRRHQVAERDVVVLSIANASGGLAPVLKLLADAGVNINYAYGSAAQASVQTTIILGVDDPLRAATAAGT
jgi:hypothetical protein